VKLVFAGTPEFALAFLEELLLLPQVEIAAVYTQPDRRAGRGKQLRPSPVKQFAESKSLTVLQPESLKDSLAQQQLAELQPDLMVVVAYGQILPESVLQIPRYGCINVHASLLPRWRGAAPIHRAIAAEDEESGISIMHMDAGLDTGDVLATAKLPIQTDETTGSLHDRLIELGRPVLGRVISAMPDILYSATPQNEDDATYAGKILAAEAALDWYKPAHELDALVRALNPAPGAYSFLGEERIKIWATDVARGSGQAGQILSVSDRGIEVACTEGSLVLRKIQLAGKPVSDMPDLLRGHASKFVPGIHFSPGPIN
jgi:methionyl-tRNA formyltransferase